MRGIGVFCAVVVIAGCGRIHFDSPHDGDSAGDGASTDAPLQVTLVYDDFTRTIANGWGNADIGGPWQLFNPNGAGLSVAPSHADVAITTTNTYADAGVVNPRARDVETRVTASINRLPVGGTYDLNVTARWVDNATAYAVTAALLPSGDVEIGIVKAINATNVDLTPATVALTGVAANDRIAFAFRATGASPTTLCAKIWRDGATEPMTCAAMVQDSEPMLEAPGSSFVGVFENGGGVPATISFQAFRYYRVGPL